MIKTFKVDFKHIKDLEIISFMELPEERRNLEFATNPDEASDFLHNAVLSVHNCLVNPRRWDEFADLELEEFGEFYAQWIAASVLHQKIEDKMKKSNKQERKQMVHVSAWEKFRKAVTGSYSEKLTYQIAQQKAEEKAAAIQIEKAKLEKAAREKALLEEKPKPSRVEKVKAEAKKTPSQPKKPEAKKPAPAKPKTASTTPKKTTAKKPAPKKVAFKADAVDGDGDGLIQDGTIHERPAPKSKKKK